MKHDTSITTLEGQPLIARIHLTPNEGTDGNEAGITATIMWYVDPKRIPLRLREQVVQTLADLVGEQLKK